MIAMQAAWATQQQSEAACTTPPSWDNCSAAVWNPSSGSCAYSLSVGCTPTCDGLFEALFDPPLALDDPCVLSAGYVEATHMCTLHLDNRCEAKLYHERYADVGGIYVGMTVPPTSGGASRLDVELLGFLLASTLVLMICINCTPLSIDDD